MTSQHTRWAPSGAETDDPERIAIREALVFGKAHYGRAFGLPAALRDVAHAHLSGQQVIGQALLECPELGQFSSIAGQLLIERFNRRNKSLLLFN